VLGIEELRNGSDLCRSLNAAEYQMFIADANMHICCSSLNMKQHQQLKIVAQIQWSWIRNH
jgi:hypothetical protein